MRRVGFGLLVCASLVAGLSGVSSAYSINSASDGSLTPSTLVDFEAGPSGTWVSESFGALTITAEDSAHVPAATFSVAGDFAGGYNTRGALHITNYGTTFEALRFDFGAPVSAFGFLFGASDESWTLSAYNTGGLLGSYVIAPVGSSNAGDFFGLAGLPGATYATLVQSQAPVDYVFLDDFRYAAGESAAVPEPATLILLGSGMLGLGGIARRRAKQ